MRPPAPPIDLTSETTHVGGSFEHIGNKKIQTCYSVTPDFFHGISVKREVLLREMDRNFFFQKVNSPLPLTGSVE